MAPDILVTRLRKEFGTITSPKFHLDWQQGAESCRILAGQVFVSVLGSFETAGIDASSKVLFEPYGKVRKGFLTGFKWDILDAYFFELRPILGRMKASIFGGRQA